MSALLDALEAQTIALRSQAITMVATCDAILHTVDAIRPAVAKPAPVLVADSDPTKCGHPKKLSTPTFADTDAWQCADCRIKSEELARIDAEANMHAAGVTPAKEG